MQRLAQDLSNVSQQMTMAQSVLRAIKTDVLSSNDIIPRADLPHFYRDQIETYANQFGREKILSFLQNSGKVATIRKIGYEMLGEHKSRFISPHSTLCIAITYCGVGECQETSNRAVLELSKQGCTSPISIVALTGKPDDTFKGADYTHQVVVIGDISALSNSISSFSALSDSCVLLDPFLGVVGNANKIQTLISAYLEAYEINKISQILPVNPLAIDHRRIEVDARFFSEEIKKKLLNFNATSRAHQAFFSVAGTTTTTTTTTTANRMESIVTTLKLRCKEDMRGRDIKQALEQHKFALALRKACAHGASDIVRGLLANRVVLNNFDTNEPSATNNKTSLDWVHEAQYDESTKLAIRNMLLDAGAVCSEQKHGGQISP